MNLDEFMAELRATQGKYVWNVDPISGSIRSDRRDGECMCPITAVFHNLTGRALNTGSFSYCGRNLGLSLTNISRIIKAADSSPRRAAPVLRKQILDAVGLGTVE